MFENGLIAGALLAGLVLGGTAMKYFGTYDAPLVLVHDAPDPLPDLRVITSMDDLDTGIAWDDGATALVIIVDGVGLCTVERSEYRAAFARMCGLGRPESNALEVRPVEQRLPGASALEVPTPPDGDE